MRKEDDSSNGNDEDEDEDEDVDKPVALCASCDRCRARKTRCDGKRPCSHCISKHIKKNNLKSLQEMDMDLCECVYSPAKRRGPVPGIKGQSRKACDSLSTDGTGVTASTDGIIPSSFGENFSGTMVDTERQQQQQLALLQQQRQQLLLAQEQQQAGLGLAGLSSVHQQAVHGGHHSYLSEAQQHQLSQVAVAQQQQQILSGSGSGDVIENGWGSASETAGVISNGHHSSMSSAPSPAGSAAQNFQQHAIQQQLNYLQQLHAQQQMAAATASSHLGAAVQAQLNNVATAASVVSGDIKSNITAYPNRQPVAQRQRLKNSSNDNKSNNKTSLPLTLVSKTVTQNMALLDKTSVYGNQLRSYYLLSVDELFTLPGIPSDSDYMSSLVGKSEKHSLLNEVDKTALQAARFAEIAIGALVHNELSMAMQLSNASVSLLKMCVLQTSSSSHLLYEVARSCFLLGCFRAFRGDIERYLKYRRVCMQHISQMDATVSDDGVHSLVAAISYLDCWSYMVHNADERKLPSIDHTIRRVEASHISPPHGALCTETEKEYSISFLPNRVVADPKNQNWMQGAPPIFLNNEAPLTARSLDALSCAFRSCCDQANGRFAQIATAASMKLDGNKAPSAEAQLQQMADISCTTAAVMAHESELCSRSMVLSACTLLQQHEASNSTSSKNQGLHLIISAMDAFLENGDGDGSGEFTDSQIQSLLSVCNTTIENPLLLHHGGPTYHMVSNAAILLCHLLNGMHAMRVASASTANHEDSNDRAMEAAIFGEVFDTFVSIRKLLNIHRRKLPVKLRCHGIPRPSMVMSDSRLSARVDGSMPLIDLGDTLMCGCRGCQGFALMACSPGVAAERARSANLKRGVETEGTSGKEQEELDKELYNLKSEFDLDDDALLNMLSRLIS